ncbi:thiamine ABC transporter substrate binding subunit [Orbus sturtevantii]|uniref:thiamine ABC transporter substrate binding subunit n=1 Tax=Orbus sturtevantii TaxID=3074109 RepID=UPI00370DCD29
MLRIISFFIILLLGLPLFAKDKPVLTVYSYSSFLSEWGPGNKIKQDFQTKCDCLVNMVSIDDGVMILNRLRLEGERSKADIIIGLDTSLIGQANKADLIQPHQMTRPTNLAIDWWDKQFIPYDYGYFAFIYNKEHITSPPQSFAELLNHPEWKIVYQDPRTSTPGLGLLLWVNNIYAQDSANIWQKLAKQTLTVTKGWSESYGLFLQGEADFVLSYTTSPAVHMINDNDHRYQAAIFDEGNYRQIELAAITKYSQQPELAKQFLAFLLTPAVQQLIAEKNIMYPAVNTTVPAAYAEIPQVTKSLSFNENEVFNNQKKWIKQWQRAVSQ